MAKEEKAKSLADFGPPSDFKLSNDECKQIVDKFTKLFGGFGPKEVNQFYEKAEIAKIAWERKQKDGTMMPIPEGFVVRAYANCTKGTKGWGKYEYFSDTPFEFWEHIFRQVYKYMAKVEYAKNKDMEALQAMADMEQYDTRNTI